MISVTNLTRDPPGHRELSHWNQPGSQPGIYEQHLYHAGASAPKVVRVLGATERAWLQIAALSTQDMEESLRI